MPKESRSRMQKWPSSTLCPPNSTVTGTTHFYPVAIRSAHVICAQALSTQGRVGMTYDKKFLLSLYQRMSLIRKFEERVKFLFLEGVMPGTIHQYNGQEGIAVGVCSALKEGDVIASTHRPHGHAVARGLSVESLLHELFGKVTGCCKGKGGSMHMGDLEKGMVPAVAIVAGAIPMATGMALAMKMKKQPNVVACFMGDGAVNEGAFHEGVNRSEEDT